MRRKELGICGGSIGGESGLGGDPGFQKILKP